MTKKDILFGILIAIGLVVFVKKDFFFIDVPNKIFGTHRFNDRVLNIVLNTPITDLSPYNLDLNNLIRTANIYEGLVSFDRNLRITPALAVTWGNINPVTWDFKLRKDVKFHDQSPFNADNVVECYNNAQKDELGQTKNLLKTVKEIKVMDPFTIQIITNKPDPLILSKLTKFLISRPNSVGTGPYMVREWAKGQHLSLTAYPDYRGHLPTYRDVSYQVTANKTQRESDFEQGSTDLLVAVPKDQALNLPKEQVKTSYSLEVNFLMFKLDDPLLSDRSMRESIRTLFDPVKIEEIGNNFVRQVSQFVAPGVFGYNPTIPPFKFDEEKRAKNLFGEQKMKINLDYLSAYKTLTEYLDKQLEEAGFSVKGNALAPEELLAKIRKNESQMFIIGWQAENGDAGDFLDSFIHSQGEFNNGRYSNVVVDKLIEKSREELNPAVRLQLLQKIMELIDNDLIGIPLFESSRLYAVKKGVIWEPRLDGLVLASEVR